MKVLQIVAVGGKWSEAEKLAKDAVGPEGTAKLPQIQEAVKTVSTMALNFACAQRHSVMP